MRKQAVPKRQARLNDDPFLSPRVRTVARLCKPDEEWQKVRGVVYVRGTRFSDNSRLCSIDGYAHPWLFDQHAHGGVYLDAKINGKWWGLWIPTLAYRISDYWYDPTEVTDEA